MRFLFCKIHCPSFVCFCKPPSHLYTLGPLKLENNSHVPSTTAIVSASSDHQDAGGGCGDDEFKRVKDVEIVLDGKQQQQREEQEQEQEEEEGGDVRVKSNLKKDDSDSKEVQKMRVQWMDFLGKELVEIREYEACEVEDTNNDTAYGKGCVCTIL
ncbi:uncharacterized protein LOC123225249 isoform X2 [Mangifera indica]|uniref:uncharacterized protein LOC123225249 isoform X2 n=1 Tax=Mangifera indica TaxID=29780 RepID=UPI001CF9FE36|nr:uncharacterized protein LOC123225249 isoform X2 [Mangifera indica]